MKASEVIARLTVLMEKYGDLEVALYADHEPAKYIEYNPESWIASEYLAKTSPVFEFNGFVDSEENEK